MKEARRKLPVREKFIDFDIATLPHQGFRRSANFAKVSSIGESYGGLYNCGTVISYT